MKHTEHRNKGRLRKRGDDGVRKVCSGKTWNRVATIVEKNGQSKPKYGWTVTQNNLQYNNSINKGTMNNGRFKKKNISADGRTT